MQILSYMQLREEDIYAGLRDLSQRDGILNQFWNLLDPFA